MKPTFWILAILMMISFVSAEMNLSYMVKIHYNNGALSLSDLKLISGEAPARTNQPYSGYTLKVISFNETVLHSFKFEIETTPLADAPREIFDEEGNQIAVPNATGSVSATTDVVLVVPYYKNAKDIRIYDTNDQLVLTIDVSGFSERETIENPPITADNSLLIGAGICLAIIVILIVFWLVMKFRKKKEPAETEGEEKPIESAAVELTCDSCGSKISEKDLFCPECGSRIKNEPKRCRKCKREINEGVKFCPYCGAKQT